MQELHFEQLVRIRERQHELIRAERKLDELRKRSSEQQALIVKLEVELEKEQEDVDRLTRMSLTSLFHTILRSKEEQLELERQEELAAALKLQEANQHLSYLKEEINKVGDELYSLSNARNEYAQYMKEKEAALRSSPHSAQELQKMEDEIGDKSLSLKEIGEALSAGRGVISSLTHASDSLQKAENWGNWDMWANGGIISTHMKHGHVDDAKNSIHIANYQLRDFKKELADLQQSTDIYIDISDMLKMADYWFDGFISDWIVQGRIQNAQEQTLEAIHKVRTVVNKLDAEYQAAERELNELKAKRIAWIEESNQ